MKEICENCKYFVKREIDDLEKYNLGFCTRYPPSISRGYNPSEDSYSCPEEQEFDSFPVVFQDEGCGEFKSKEVKYE